MTLSSSQREIVRTRAGNCCEFCRLPESSGTITFHLDHIIPLKHGGSNTTDNHCLACYKCNAHKSHDLSGFDPLTGDLTLLFHPRKQTWDEHFELKPDMQIEGRTPEGRTTVNVLQMNDEDRVENRQLLFKLGEYPCAKK